MRKKSFDSIFGNVMYKPYNMRIFILERYGCP